MRAIAYTDGSGGSPRGSTCACTISDEEGTIIAEASQVFTGCVSNNIAEYGGVILAITTAIDNGVTDLQIFTDSQLIENQLKGNWKCEQNDLKQLRDSARLLAEDLDNIDIDWVPREKNKRADALCRIALDAHHPPSSKKKSKPRSKNPFKVSPSSS